MRGINKAIIVGTLGKDPDVRYLQDGTAVASLSLATNEQWKDKNTGVKQERTEWHRVSMFGRLAEIAGEYLRKGSQVYVEGQIRTRKWTDQQGVERYSTEITAREMQMLGGGQQSGGQAQQSQQRAPAQQQYQPQPAEPEFNDFDDDIPF